MTFSRRVGVNVLTKNINKTSQVVQQLRLLVSNAGGTGSTTGQSTEIPQAMWHSQKTRKYIGNCVN